MKFFKDGVTMYSCKSFGDQNGCDQRDVKHANTNAVADRILITLMKTTDPPVNSKCRTVFQQMQQNYSFYVCFTACISDISESFLDTVWTIALTKLPSTIQC